MPFTRAEFLKELERASEIVASWPEWKQEHVAEALINSLWRKGSPQRQMLPIEELAGMALPKTLQTYVDYMAKEDRPVTFSEIVAQTPAYNGFTYLVCRRLIKIYAENKYKDGEPYTGPRETTYVLSLLGRSQVTKEQPSEPAPVPELEHIDFACMTFVEAKAALSKLSDSESLDKTLLWLRRVDALYATMSDAIAQSGIPMACRDRAMIVLLMQQNERYRADAMKMLVNQPMYIKCLVDKPYA